MEVELNEHEAQAINDGHIIERSGDAQPTYLSEKIGRDFGSPYGGWTTDREQATVYELADAMELMERPLANIAPFCKVVPK
jgi:hypothetical protein